MKCTTVDNLVLKIHDGGQQNVLNRLILHHHEISQEKIFLRWRSSAILDFFKLNF